MGLKDMYQKWLRKRARGAVTLPVFSHTLTFLNTVAGNNLFAACSHTGDFEPYKQAKRAWNRHQRRHRKEDKP